jgi:acetyl-CoA acyltransferase
MIHAGNSSQITDGASAVLLMGEDTAAELGLTPRARVHSFAVIGSDPILMLTGPIATIIERLG